jgi:hypothetical protein
MKRREIAILCIALLLGFEALFSQTGKKPAKITKNPSDIKIQKLDILNSKYQENNISITPDGKYLFFMSESPSSWSTKDYAGKKDRYDGDIWYSKSSGGNWQKPQNIGQAINTPQGEDEPNISPDGQTVIFQSWKTDWLKDGGPYYKAELSGTKWKNPVGLGGGITKFFEDEQKNSGNSATDGATFSADGKKMIIAYGRDYYGNMDLYMATKDKNGKWSTFKKLPISTSFNERCPFLAADGKTLYFASNGYNGFGKLDIYKTTLNNDGTCGEVINIGEPFNTKDDDYGFVLTASGNDAYFIRNGDIYYTDLKKLDEEIKPDPTVIISGIVTDSITKKPLEAVINVYDQSTKQIIGSSRSNSKTGEYSIVLTKGKKYNLAIDKKDYRKFSHEFDINQNAKYSELKKDIALAKPVEEIKIETPPIVEKDTIKPVIIEKKEPEKEVVQKEDTVKHEEPAYIEPPPNKCLVSKLYDACGSIGLAGAFPWAGGIKLEADYHNFAFAISGLYFPQIGNFDETVPSDDLKGDNNSTFLLIAGTYHIQLGCNFYPFIGLYYGNQYRHWKKFIEAQKSVLEGDYTAYHYGISLGAKYFLSDEWYLEGSLGLGRNSVHEQPGGNFIREDFQVLAWFSICYKFNLDF